MNTKDYIDPYYEELLYIMWKLRQMLYMNSGLTLESSYILNTELKKIISTEDFVWFLKDNYSKFIEIKVLIDRYSVSFFSEEIQQFFLEKEHDKLISIDLIWDILVKKYKSDCNYLPEYQIDFLDKISDYIKIIIKDKDEFIKAINYEIYKKIDIFLAESITPSLLKNIYKKSIQLQKCAEIIINKFELNGNNFYLYSSDYNESSEQGFLLFLSLLFLEKQKLISINPIYFNDGIYTTYFNGPEKYSFSVKIENITKLRSLIKIPTKQSLKSGDKINSESLTKNLDSKIQDRITLKISYIEETKELIINNNKIGLSKNQNNIFRILFKYRPIKDDLDFGEIAEEIDSQFTAYNKDRQKDIKKGHYNSVNELRKKIIIKTGIKGFFITTNNLVKFNPKYEYIFPS